jgi:hypothetical protein
MKHLSKIFLFSVLLFAVASCEKDEHKIYFEGGTAPVLTSSVAGTIPMSFKDAAKEAVVLSWTNPDYKFTTGVSSQDVSYLLEIDTTGSNFTNPKRRTLSIKSALSKTITQGELNDYLLNTLELKPEMPHAVEMRVTASLTGNAEPLSSNVLAFTITPYTIPPKVAPPASGTLFIIGDATPGGWDNPVPAPAQEFTQISPTLYEITITLTGGKSYLFIPVNGSWDAKFGFTGDKNKNNTNGDDLKAGGNDLKAPDASGTYKIQVNFQTGKFTLTKQ